MAPNLDECWQERYGRCTISMQQDQFSQRAFEFSRAGAWWWTFLAFTTLEESLMPQPVGTGLCPCRAGMIAAADTEVVGGGGMDV